MKNAHTRNRTWKPLRAWISSPVHYHYAMWAYLPLIASKDNPIVWGPSTLSVQVCDVGIYYYHLFLVFKIIFNFLKKKNAHTLS